MTRGRVASDRRDWLRASSGLTLLASGVQRWANPRMSFTWVAASVESCEMPQELRAPLSAGLLRRMQRSAREQAARELLTMRP